MDDLVVYPALLLALLCVLLLIRGFHSLWWKPKMLQRNLKQQGIMGTPYRPLIGDMKEFVKLITQAWSKPMNLNHKIVSRVDPFTLNNVQKYGKISMCWSGTSPRLIIKDPELMRQVLSNKQGHFQKPPLNPNILIITKGLSTLEGYKWERRRKTLNPAFHMERLKEMLPVFSTSCSKMIERWQNKSKLEEGKCEIDVWPELQKVTADVISRAAFGSNYEEGERIFELLRELTILVVEAMQTLYLPGFRFIPTKKNQRRKELNREIRSMLRDLIQRKKHALRHGESRVDDDLLGLLLQSISQNNDDGNESYKMTEEDVVEECKQFYVAGHETTSSWLTWTMVVLAMHPDWQEKARNEVLQIGHRQELNYKTITKLKIINMILYEVVRLYPPVIALYQHTSKETKIGDISLPSGVDLTLPILLLNHDPQIWGDDAEEFKPERFSEGVSKASNEQLAFFPFSWGPRTCIGQNFAMLEAKMAIAMILQHFSWDLSPSYVHAPYTVMTLQPQHGAQITLHPL